MARPHKDVDWYDAVDRVAAAEGEWILVANDVPEHTVRIVKERQNLALREVGKMDARMLETYGTPPRGDLWMRSLPGWKPPRRVGDGRFFRIEVPLSLKRDLVKYASDNGVSVSSLVDKALVRIAARGRRKREDQHGAHVAANVSTARWERARKRAETDGFVLSKALREELRYEVRGRR